MAINFSGAPGNDEGLRRDNFLSAAGNDFTFMAWVYPIETLPTSTDGYRNYLCLENGAVGGAIDAGVHGTGSGTVWSIGTNLNDFDAASGPSLNTWYHVAITRTGNTKELFIDGVSVVSGSDAHLSTATDFNIGDFYRNGPGSGSGPGGRIAAVKCWQAVLSQAEIQAEMAQYMPVRKTNLRAVYPLFDLTSDNDDFSGNDLTLTTGAEVSIANADGPPIEKGIHVVRVTSPAAVNSGIAVATFSGTPRIGNMIVTPGNVWGTGSPDAPSISDQDGNSYAVHVDQPDLNVEGFAIIASAPITATRANLQVSWDTNVADTAKVFSAMEVYGLDALILATGDEGDEVMPAELSTGALSKVPALVVVAWLWIGTDDAFEGIALTTWGGSSPVTLWVNDGPGIVGEFGAAGYVYRDVATAFNVGFTGNQDRPNGIAIAAWSAEGFSDPEGPITDGPKYHFLSGMRW